MPNETALNKQWMKPSVPSDKTLVTKLKLWLNSKIKMWQNLKTQKSDEAQKLKLWWKSKTQIVTKLPISNCEEEKNSRHWMWQNLHCDKTKKTNCDKTKKLKLWQNLNYEKEEKIKKVLLVRTFWHLDNQWYVLCAAFCDSRDVSRLFLHCQYCCVTNNIIIRLHVQRYISININFPYL